MRLISSVAGVESSIEEPGERLRGQRRENMPVEARLSDRRDVQPSGASDADDREPAEANVATQPPDESYAVGIRHGEVTEDQVRPSTEREAEGLLAISGVPCPDTECRGQRDEGGPCICIVLNDEDLEVPWPWRTQRLVQNQWRKTTEHIAVPLQRAAIVMVMTRDPARETEAGFRGLPPRSRDASRVPLELRDWRDFLGLAGRRGRDSASSRRQDVAAAACSRVRISKVREARRPLSSASRRS